MKGFITITLLALVSLSVCQAEIRKWTNKEGKEIQAEVIRVDGNKVVFLMRGEEMSYPIEDLIQADRDWLKIWEKEQKEKLAAELEAKRAEATNFEGVELQPGKRVSFELKVAEDLAAKSADGGTPVEKTNVSIAVPEGFAPLDPSKKYRFLVINATSGGNGSSTRHMGGYVSGGLARDCVVFAVDHSDGEAAHDNTAFRWSVQKNAMNYFHDKWPTSKDWPVILAGFSGGAKWSGLLAGHYLEDGNKVAGMFMGGCNSDLTDDSLRDAKPKKSDFVKIPIWISNGTKDDIADVPDGERIKASMEGTGFKNVRLESYEGGHRLSKEEFAKALDWFIELLED